MSEEQFSAIYNGEFKISSDINDDHYRTKKVFTVSTNVAYSLTKKKIE